MKKTAKIVVGLLFLYSCHTKTSITLKNNTTFLIDSVKISNGFDFIYSGEILKNETKKYNLKFSDLTPNTDGNFYIETFPNHEIRVFGYYTNGLQPKSSFFITIKKDSILVRESL